MFSKTLRVDETYGIGSKTYISEKESATMNLHFEQLKTIGVVISSLGIDSSAESSLGLDAIRSHKEHLSDRRNLLNKTEHWLTVPKRHRINKAFSYWRSYLKLEISICLSLHCKAHA